MNRVWLLTWTTYGQWLPGDRRGFVGGVRTPDWEQILHNLPGTSYDCDMPALVEYCRQAMKGPPVILNFENAERLMDQFIETANYRGWELAAAAVMANHVHAVIGVPDDPDPSTLLQSMKAYGSRKLNREFGRPVSETWWTESGSKRKLATQSAVDDGVEYVKTQAHALVVYSKPP